MTVGNHHAEFRTGLLLQVVAQPCCCGVWVFWQQQRLLLVLMVDIDWSMPAWAPTMPNLWRTINTLGLWRNTSVDSSSMSCTIRGSLCVASPGLAPLD